MLLTQTSEISNNMAIINPDKSLATKDSNSHELYENRKVYKKNTLTHEAHRDEEPQYMWDGIADFWYDRQLYGKINRLGDIVIIREDFLKVLKTDSKKTLYALNFVALAFSEMKNYFEKETVSNRMPNKNTMFSVLNPAAAWDSIYDKYHEYMTDIYSIFVSYLDNNNRNQNINNFNEFVEEFFIFFKNIMMTSNSAFTLSGFVTDSKIDSRCGGLTIDLFRARASNDILKEDLFINDKNFNFLLHSANKHGFVVDKNIPWRLIANLSSDYMKLVMESPNFDVTYPLGARNLFDAYYLKTYTLDLIFLRKYMYDMYNSLIASTPFYSKYEYCNNIENTKKLNYYRRPLTTPEMEKIYTVRNYWMEKFYRFRLEELPHDLNEEDIRRHIKNSKSIYDIRGERAALRYLHNQEKRFFLNQYNVGTADLKRMAPQHAPEIISEL